MMVEHMFVRGCFFKIYTEETSNMKIEQKRRLLREREKT